MKRKVNANLLVMMILISIFAIFFGASSVRQPIYSSEIEEDDSISTRILTSDNPIDIPFVYGMRTRLRDLDPHYSWDRDSFDVIQQVCEGLYGYDYSDPEMDLIPYLATTDGTWSPDGLNYTVPLKSGVTFHDGTLFNASAVKFTFDRLSHLTNATGTLPVSSLISILKQLYEFKDGTPIIERTEVIDTYTIRFILNAPYAPLQALLCFSGSYILSPTSTPSMDYIDTNTGDLVGTGPFMYDGYIPNVEVNFHAYDDYWQGKADINQMKFKIITDTKQRQLALINGEVHFISSLDPDYFDAFNAIPYITFLDTGKTSSLSNFLGMNTRQINVIFREAISYAIDYDYIVNEVYGGSASRMKSPIPEGLRYANSTFDYPILNLTRARLAIQSLGYGVGFDLYNDAEWVNQGTNAPFATFNYTYNIGSQIREDILPVLRDSLVKIGIRVTDAGTTWAEFIYSLYEIGGNHRNELQLFWISWMADYNDPYYFLNEIFTNRTKASNYVQYNGGKGSGGPFQPYGPLPYDPTEDVQLLMEAALIEMDSIAREAIYDEIQRLLIERDFPYAWGTVGKLYYAHHVNLTGFQPNALEIRYFYPCHWDPWYISPVSDPTFKVGVQYGPNALDPQNSWDLRSYQTIDQVCEGLYGYNYSDPETAIIPYLATAGGTWSPDGLNYTVPLRTGVTFHDGAPFNASAVKFTFDRLAYLMDNDMANVEDLYEFSDAAPIINRTEIIDTYTIKFILNAPYSPLQALLCLTGSYILSPISTPAITLIDTTTGNLIGTGPFVYDGYIPDVEVNFHAYNDYWQGKADIKQMKFKIYNNLLERSAALLSGDIDFIDELLPEWVDIYKSFLNITVLDEGKTSAQFSFIGMNNLQINVGFREAISYAIDYAYINNEIREGSATRMKSPIPDGIRYANSTFNYPILNLTHARLVMQSMGYGVGFNLNNDAEWENAATTGPFATFSYTYNIGDKIREPFLLLLQDNLAKIGIEVTDAGTTWAEYIYMLYEIGGNNRDMLQLFHLSWGPYFNDPSSIFDLMLSNTSIHNFAQVNDLETSQWMQDALIETNPIQREILYDKIQKRLVEEVYPWVWCSVPKLTTAHHEDLTGFQQNAFKHLYFYPCKWIRGVPGPFVLSSDAGTPETDGNFNLAWTISNKAMNYTVYQNDDYINEINGSLTPLAVETTGLTLPLTIGSNGTYYFIVVAHNENGDTLSNCISVVVSLPPPGSFVMASNADSPDIDGMFDLLWSSASNADNYSVYQYHDFISTINGSLTILAVEITSFTILLSSYTSGTYYFIVVAHNQNGDTLSNCISVDVLIPDTITIIAPDSSTSWEPGTSQYINWTSTGSISNIKIDIYNNDLFVMEITSSTINDGGFYWVIPSEFVDSNQYQIRIIDVSNPSTYVYSDYFEIKTPVSAQPAVPGYNLYILIGIICVFSAIFVKNRFKNKIIS